MLARFEGFQCDLDEASPVKTFFFFSTYIILTSWVILSLFIGVISMGMFEAFEEMKNEVGGGGYACALLRPKEKTSDPKKAS